MVGLFVVAWLPGLRPGTLAFPYPQWRGPFQPGPLSPGPDERPVSSNLPPPLLPAVSPPPPPPPAVSEVAAQQNGSPTNQATAEETQ